MQNPLQCYSPSRLTRFGPILAVYAVYASLAGVDCPNILYLHSHDTGRYIQPYGYAVPTPHLQQLAQQGVMFRQAFCANPTCSPSRAALLTGQCAHSAGMLGLAHRGFRLNDYRQHLIHTLRDQAGYESTLCGIQHIAHGPDAATKIIGYDRFLPSDHHNRSQVIAEFLHSKPKQPFFLSAGFFETHREFPEPACDEPLTDPRYVRPPAFLPDTPEARHDMAAYNTMARTLDRHYGRVLQALDESGLAENTLVICTTDHGIAFPFAKCNLTDHGIGVLMILHGPKGSGFEGGKVIDAMVSQIDIFPTICELLSLQPPPWLEGRSFLPLVTGQAELIRDEVFAEVNYHAAYEPMRAVRTRRYKYIRRYDDRARPVLPNCDDSISKTVVYEAGWCDRPPEQELLFDLMLDPNESVNLASRPEMSDVLADMRSRLDRWMRQTNDPLLSSQPIPLPEGAVVNNADDYSPQAPTRPASA